MQRNSWLILTGIFLFFVLSIFGYQQHYRAEALAGRAIANIDLRYFGQRAIQISANTFQQRLQKADALFLEAPIQAMGIYQDLLKQDPGNLSLRMRMGMLQLKLRQYEAAREHLHVVYDQKEALLQPDACWFLGLLAVLEGNSAQAQVFLKESLEAGSQYQSQAEAVLKSLQ